MTDHTTTAFADTSSDATGSTRRDFLVKALALGGSGMLLAR